jgi:hypothetical protein
MLYQEKSGIPAFFFFFSGSRQKQTNNPEIFVSPRREKNNWKETFWKKEKKTFSAAVWTTATNSTQLQRWILF